MQDVHTRLQVGSVIHDRYLIEGLLGQGGFGAVYLVRDQRVRGNLFALKEIVDASKKERGHFTLEGEILRRLDHPALPRVYSSFEEPDKYRAYILMDYIEGQNLEHLRKQQPGQRFPLVQVMQMMAPIFDAVGYLHQQHPPIVHRDIKPANIIIPSSSSGNGAVLVDFGIAKEYDMEATTTAVRRATPGYGAPEQYDKGTNPQTDIYGLAATMYVLLTGAIPADALYRLTQMGSKNVDPLEPVTSFVPDIPQYVADALQRAMTISSKERFSSVSEFWQALQSQDGVAGPIAAQQGRIMPVTPAPISSPAPTATTRHMANEPRNRRRSRSLLVIVAVFILLGLLAGTVAGIYYMTGAQVKQTRSATPVATHHVVTSQPTATAKPTTAPSPTSTTAPPPPPSSVPKLAGSYRGSISDKQTNPPTNTSMSLSQIQQSNENIQGNFSVGPGLLASNSFSGTVSPNKQIRFIVPSYNGLSPLLFEGQIQQNGSMGGTYCSYRNGQCDRNAGGWGDWYVQPS